MQEKITLSGVPETMLQTVYARARESSGRGAGGDPKAEELIGRLDYDFSPAEKDAPMRSGVIARTIVLDRLVGKWLAAHPGAVVVNIACGLDTRCCRMSGYAHWYDLDLPETMAVRERLLPASDADFEGDAYRRTCLRFFKLMCATSLGKICASDHAMNAVDEMSVLDRDIKHFFDENGGTYPVWCQLEREAGRYLQ